MSHERRSPCCDLEAIRYINAHPSDHGNYFTVDSLAAALLKRTDDLDEYGARKYATSIIQAAKEAERE